VGSGGPACAGKPADVAEPVGTVMPESHRCLAAVLLSKLYGAGVGQPVDRPCPTVAAGGGAFVTANIIVSARLLQERPAVRQRLLGECNQHGAAPPDKARIGALPAQDHVGINFQVPVTQNRHAKSRWSDHRAESSSPAKPG
jgi:hypothetical protein